MSSTTFAEWVKCRVAVTSIIHEYPVVCSYEIDTEIVIESMWLIAIRQMRLIYYTYYFTHECLLIFLYFMGYKGQWIDVYGLPCWPY